MLCWETVEFSCYFCCFYADQEEEGEDEESQWTIIQEEETTEQQNRHRPCPPRRLDTCGIGRLLKSVCVADYHRMDAVQRVNFSEIDRLIDETECLDRAIKETLKALYRITNRREQSACVQRIHFLLARYDQQLQYYTEQTFDDILVYLEDRMIDTEDTNKQQSV